MADLKNLTNPSENTGITLEVTGAPLPEREQASPLARRQRALLVIACGTAVVSAVGMAASFWVKSPAEVAARAKPPQATVLTAPVERKVLQRTVVFRGTFAATRTVDFTPSSALSPDGKGNDSGSNLVITKARREGGSIQPGMVLAEVSYRPIFTLRGRIPAIRDLVQGASGPDVAQLQRGLAELGHGRGADREGHFGSGTARAVRRFYAALGYPAPTTAGSQPNASQAPGARDDIEPTNAIRSPSSLVQVPRSEVVMIPSFPAQIGDVGGVVGSKVTGTLLRVTLGSLTLTGHLDPSSEEAVRIGQHVDVLLEDTGKRYRAEVTKIGRLVRPKQNADDSTPYIPVVITARQPWSTAFTGQDARITVTAAATKGKVLAVPVGAITAPADGQTSVTVIAASGERRRVPVTAGMSADGYVEVNPTGGRLQEGENVVVGR